MDVVKSMQVEIPGELSEPMNRLAAVEYLAAGHGQLFGQFLLDREGIVRWSFTEVPEGGHRMFATPSPQELMSAATHVAG